MTQHRNTSRLSSINLLIIITRLIDNSNSDRLSASSPCPYHYQSLICSTVLLNFKQSIAKTRENRLIVGLSVAFSGHPATSLEPCNQSMVQHTNLLTTELCISIPRAIRGCYQRRTTAFESDGREPKKKSTQPISHMLSFWVYNKFNTLKLTTFHL